MLSYNRCIQSESSGTACHIPVCQLSVIIHASGKMHWHLAEWFRQYPGEHIMMCRPHMAAALSSIIHCLQTQHTVRKTRSGNMFCSMTFWLITLLGRCIARRSILKSRSSILPRSYRRCFQSLSGFHYQSASLLLWQKQDAANKNLPCPKNNRKRLRE